MHSFARHLHRSAGEASTKETKGLILNGGWRYDLMGWFMRHLFVSWPVAGAEAEDRQPGPHSTRRAGTGCGLRHGNAGD